MKPTQFIIGEHYEYITSTDHRRYGLVIHTKAGELTMNNLQFIATYIHDNPDNATFSEIQMNLLLWKGYPIEFIGNREISRGWYTRYFNKAIRSQRRYHGELWVKTDPKNRRSGYRLTEKGKKYVCK